MNPIRFDRFTKLLGAATSRRGALTGLMGGLLAPLSVDDNAVDARKRKRHRRKVRKKGRRNGRRTERNRRAQGQQRQTTQAEARRCCSRNDCTPGRGKNLDRCCLEDRDLSGQNLRGANLGRANLIGVDLRGADLRGANLGGSCLVDTNLRGARLGGVNLGNAIFCHTLMPDGTRNISGCVDGTSCCPTCHAGNPCPGQELCCNGRCRIGECCDADDCAERACETKSCEDNSCRYEPIPNGVSGPACAAPRICCTEPGNNPVCCPVGDTTCNEAGVCCAPNCGGKECGPDGCGGSCGTCPSGQICNTGGQCVCTAASCPNGCCDSNEACHTPPDDAFCGTNGESCKTCTGQDQCQAGRCVCVPDCAGKSCGADGCGGDCPPGCDAGLTCCGEEGCKNLETDSQNCGGCGLVCANDEPCLVGSCGCDVCASGCRFSTLQDAIDAADEGGTIRICPGDYRTNVTIAKSLTIVGAGFNTTLFGGNAGTVLTNEASNLTLQDLVVTGGKADFGGGIVNAFNIPPASLTLIGCAVIGNSANFGGSGGGIAIGGGTVILGHGSQVNTNTTQGVGGGISLNGGALTLRSGSLVFDNNSQIQGGGINIQGGTVTLETGSRVEDNGAQNFGGGIYNEMGTVVVEDDAIVTGNQTGGDGGGIYNQGGTVTIADSRDVAGNLAAGSGDNCAGAPPVPNCFN